MKNPFPGMNPWLEEYWRDVHAHLLVYAADQLNGELPPDLTASVDERLVIDVEEDEPRTYVPDVAVNVALDLQALVDQCYERSRYERKIDYSKPPEPALPPEELAWAREIVAASAG